MASGWRQPVQAMSLTLSGRSGGGGASADDTPGAWGLRPRHPRIADFRDRAHARLTAASAGTSTPSHATRVDHGRLLNVNPSNKEDA